jgi:hypothetical protein
VDIYDMYVSKISTVFLWEIIWNNMDYYGKESDYAIRYLYGFYVSL